MQSKVTQNNFLVSRPISNGVGDLKFYFSATPTAQNGPRLKVHVGNVSQDISVY